MLFQVFIKMLRYNVQKNFDCNENITTELKTSYFYNDMYSLLVRMYFFFQFSFLSF